MNWRRVKTILIIALLGVNLVLAFILLEQRKVDQIEVIDRSLIMDLLDQRQIEMSEDLFDVKHNLSNLKLKIQTYDTEAFIPILKDTYKGYRMRTETSIEQNKALYYMVYGFRYEPSTISEAEAVENGRNLLKRLGYDESTYYLEGVHQEGQAMILTYGQQIDGFVLRDSKMILTFNNDNLLEFYRLWYDVVESNVSENTYYEPEYIIYKFIGQVYDRLPDRQETIEVENLDLVYQLSPDQVIDINNSALEGEARITYRVRTSDGQVYLFQAIID